MSVGVIDAGIVIGWFRRAHRSYRKLEALFDRCRQGQDALVISVVNLAEVFKHTAAQARLTGVDPAVLLRAYRVEIHTPDQAVAFRVARLPTSLADGFAVATAQELGVRLHTTDGELVRQIKPLKLTVTHY